MTNIRLLIADDHEVVRQGLLGLLQGTEIEVVAEADTPAAAIELTRQHQPDVALIDIRMVDGGDGLTVLETIQRDLPETRVIMLSAFDNPTYIARANALGAAEYLLKGCSREQLLETIRSVAVSTRPTAHGELRKVAGTMATREKSGEADASLTERETQVLRHLALGLSNKEIAKSLSISVETVKEHVQHVLRKIDVHDRTQAAVWAVRRGIV